MKHSKQTPKPSRALIAAVQRRDRPMMRAEIAHRDSALAPYLSTCKCGFNQCAKRGPCAPAAPPPAPVAGEARRFVVGQRVRGTGGDIAGRLATVIRWESDDCVIVRFDGDDCHTWAHPGPLEPAPSPAVEPANTFDHAAAVIAAHDREAVERARGAR